MSDKRLQEIVASEIKRSSVYHMQNGGGEWIICTDGEEEVHAEMDKDGVVKLNFLDEDGDIVRNRYFTFEVKVTEIHRRGLI